MKQKLVVIGSGMVGSRFIENLLDLDSTKYQISVFNKEPRGGYTELCCLLFWQVKSLYLNHDP